MLGTYRGKCIIHYDQQMYFLLTEEFVGKAPDDDVGGATKQFESAHSTALLHPTRPIRGRSSARDGCTCPCVARNNRHYHHICIEECVLEV